MKGIGWPAVQKILCKSLIQLYEAEQHSTEELDLFSSKKGSRACDMLWGWDGDNMGSQPGH